MYCGGKESPSEVRLIHTQESALARFFNLDWDLRPEDKRAPIQLWLSGSPDPSEVSDYSFAPYRLKTFEPENDFGFRNFMEPKDGSFLKKFSLKLNPEYQIFPTKPLWPIEIILPGATMLLGFDFQNSYGTGKELPFIEWKDMNLHDGLSGGVAKQFEVRF